MVMMVMMMMSHSISSTLLCFLTGQRRDDDVLVTKGLNFTRWNKETGTQLTLTDQFTATQSQPEAGTHNHQHSC